MASNDDNDEVNANNLIVVTSGGSSSSSSSSSRFIEMIKIHCCHVRTGTMAIGIWHASLHLAALSLVAIIVSHPEKLMDLSSSSSSSSSSDIRADNKSYQLSIAAVDFSFSFGNLLTKPGITIDEAIVALFVNVCAFIVTLCMIYGAWRSQPSHLMPFFFLKIFDFCIFSMTAIGYLSYLPNIRQLIRDTPTFIFRQQLLGMNANCLKFIVIVVCISMLLVKGYCIGIVWKYYKFLMRNAQVGEADIRYSGPINRERWGRRRRHNHVGDGDDDLPDYETVLGDKNKFLSIDPPPPSYDDVMAGRFS